MLKDSDDVLIAPSILAADFLQLGDEIESVVSADFLHYDVMDGRFVPNLSFGPSILTQVESATKLPIDCHLMVECPEDRVMAYAHAGARSVTFHWEAQRHADRIVQKLHDEGVKAAIALNPATPVSALETIIDQLDMVLVMTVNPGYGGQAFIPYGLTKLRQLSRLCADHGVSPLIEVDGGVTMANVEEVVRAGARVLVAGSAIFGQQDRAKAISELREQGRKGLLRSV